LNQCGGQRHVTATNVATNAGSNTAERTSRRPNQDCRFVESVESEFDAIDRK